MPGELLKLAETNGIVVEYWNFKPPLQGVYWAHPGLPPVIGLSSALCANRIKLRCVLAEELGHHFTTVGQYIPQGPVEYFNYGKRLEISFAEARALRWAAQYLIPLDALIRELKSGLRDRELAECFEVTLDLMRFRLQLGDLLPENSRWHF